MFCLVGSLLIIADSINFAEMIMMFLLNGYIPGTNLAINPTIMMVLMTGAGLAVISKTKIVSKIKKISNIKQDQKQSVNRRKLKHT